MNPLFYEEWNRKRIKAIIDHYGHKTFYYKKILDLGSFNGDIAAAFVRLGADVMCIDARQEHINTIQKRHKFLKTMKVDLDNEWPFHGQRFDFVFSLGTMCHLKDYERHIRNLCELSEHIVLETEVLDSFDSANKVVLYEDKHTNDLSFHGEGSIVSTINIENILSLTGAKFKRIKDPKLNSHIFKYDWTETGSGRNASHRAMWFIYVDRHFVAKLKANEQLRQAEINANVYVPPPIIDQPLPEHRTLRAERNEPIRMSIKRTALCIFGDMAEGNRDQIRGMLGGMDIFIHSFNDGYTDELRALSPTKLVVEDAGTLSKNEQFFIGLGKVIAMKENVEQNASDAYDKVILLNASIPFRHIDLGRVLDKIWISRYDGIQWIYSTSFAADMYGQIYKHIGKYLENGCPDDITSLFEYGMKDLGMRSFFL